MKSKRSSQIKVIIPVAVSIIIVASLLVFHIFDQLVLQQQQLQKQQQQQLQKQQALQKQQQQQLQYQKLGLYAEAVKTYDQALAIDPNNTDILRNKGIVLLKAADYTDAIKIFDKILAIDPNNVVALYNKGAALDILGEHVSAKTYKDKALRIDPKYTGNIPPTAINQSVSTNLNTPVDITLAGSDPDLNDTLTAAIVANPSHGTLGNINQDAGVITYTPNQGFTGDDSFSFKVNDGKTDSSNTATVNIRVGGG